MFTSKHYIVLAACIRDTWTSVLFLDDEMIEEDRDLIYQGVETLAIRIADSLAMDNSEFDRVRFFHACRLPGLT